jgi:hypothetical protein
MNEIGWLNPVCSSLKGLSQTQFLSRYQACDSKRGSHVRYTGWTLPVKIEFYYATFVKDQPDSNAFLISLYLRLLSGKGKREGIKRKKAAVRLTVLR